MEKLMREFENKKAEIVFEWNDTETDAKGWIVINSLRGGAAAGGTRMRVGVTENEVLSLAKTMEVKFTVAGPPIGGGKSGINFDPRDPRKKDVLKRWYKAVAPLLKNYYGTGGDMNVDEVHEVIPFCKEADIDFPLEGIINGHLKLQGKEKDKIINQLTLGVPLLVTDLNLAPKLKLKYSVGDLITGYGVSESVIHYFRIYGGNLKNKRVIIQGWGNVAATAAYYLSKAGALVVGIIDKNGGLLSQNGFNYKEISKLLEQRTSNFLEDKKILSFGAVNDKIWDIGAEIFIPAAASRLLTENQLERMVKNNLQIISSGANVPFADKEIFFGPIAKKADNLVSVIPDFISNCGMARVFSYLMQNDAQLNDKAIFEAVSTTIYEALKEVKLKNTDNKNIAKTAFEIALTKLI
ncbi:MAG: Glu/Leu/Phe/Val dehydrogenase dimerization domain-containing protein [Flavobacteriales bacterium]|jgi:glutamate dehydrogenase/leucine dehydrogenase|nr:amino acid dehydrogenase [Flavobacteriales bacterium]|tara:strand:+ start:36332 stop:37558 length:1227 start_codon:yes stop_codon:yes gene_type:complete